MCPLSGVARTTMVVIFMASPNLRVLFALVGLIWACKKIGNLL